MTDFRALCAELLDEVPHESPLTCLARAALAQPEPEVVTNEEIEREALDNSDTDDEYRAFKSGAFFVRDRISRPAIKPVPAPSREEDSNLSIGLSRDVTKGFLAWVEDQSGDYLKVHMDLCTDDAGAVCRQAAEELRLLADAFDALATMDNPCTPNAHEAAMARAAELRSQAQPEPQGPTDEELDLVVIAIQALTPHQPDATTHDLDAIDRGREILKERLACWGQDQQNKETNY